MISKPEGALLGEHCNLHSKGPTAGELKSTTERSPPPSHTSLSVSSGSVCAPLTGSRHVLQRKYQTRPFLEKRHVPDEPFHGVSRTPAAGRAALRQGPSSARSPRPGRRGTAGEPAAPAPGRSPSRHPGAKRERGTK